MVYFNELYSAPPFYKGVLYFIHKRHSRREETERETCILVGIKMRQRDRLSFRQTDTKRSMQRKTNR